MSNFGISLHENDTFCNFRAFLKNVILKLKFYIPLDFAL